MAKDEQGRTGRTGPKVFDATGKRFIDLDPLAWVHLAGIPGRQAEVVDSDLTVSLSADRLVRVSDPDCLVNFEAQAGPDPDVPLRMLGYRILARLKYRLPMESVLILLSSRADSPAFLGRLDDDGVTYPYHVVRIWEIDPEVFLVGSLALLPFAALARTSIEQMPEIVERIQIRAAGEASAATQRDLWNGVRLLLGLRMSREQSAKLLKGVFAMLDLRESDTYQEILEEGEARGLAKGEEIGEAKGKREFLLRAGSRRFGAPKETETAALAAVADGDLDRLVDRLFEVETWQDLLA